MTIKCVWYTYQLNIYTCINYLSTIVGSRGDLIDPVKPHHLTGIVILTNLRWYDNIFLLGPQKLLINRLCCCLFRCMDITATWEMLRVSDTLLVVIWWCGHDGWERWQDTCYRAFSWEHTVWIMGLVQLWSQAMYTSIPISSGTWFYKKIDLPRGISE